MGFLAGLFSGITLTTALIYLPLHAHHRNRTAQALLLRQQSTALVSLVEPSQPWPEDPAPRRRELQRGLLEEVKERWNEEVEGAVRWVQGVDWRGVRERVEERVGDIWERVGRS